MGLSGQTLFANSDGTISVDGSLLTIQGQPVQLAGHVPSTAFGYASIVFLLFATSSYIQQVLLVTLKHTFVFARWF